MLESLVARIKMINQDNIFVIYVDDLKQDNDCRCGVIDAQGEIIIPFIYEYISSADGFETNNLLVAETLDHVRVFINLKNNAILLRD